MALFSIHRGLLHHLFFTVVATKRREVHLVLAFDIVFLRLLSTTLSGALPYLLLPLEEEDSPTLRSSSSR